MEYIRIVDENGNYTGEILERKEAHDRNLLHNEVAVFIINDNNQVLLQKRSASKRFNPNKWGVCAGHVSADETLEEAALREVEEEIGLSVKQEELIPLTEKDISIRKINSHISYLYYIKANKDISEFKIQREELSEVKWFFIDDVIDMIKSHDETLVFSESKLYVFELLKQI